MEPFLSLDEKSRLSKGSVPSLNNGSHSRQMRVSIIRLENIELSKSTSKCFQITPSLSAAVSVWPHLSIHICHVCPFFLVTTRLLCFLRAVILLLFHFFDCCQPDSSAFLTSSLSLSTLQDPNMSVLLKECPEVPNEVTLTGSVSTPRVSQPARDHMNALKVLLHRLTNEVLTLFLSTVRTWLTHPRLPENLF